MRGGVLPPALLFAALACVLSFARRDVRLAAAAVAAIVAFAAALLPLSVAWTEPAFAGCWISAIVTAALVHARPLRTMPTALALAGNAGWWSGATTAVAGSTPDLLIAAAALSLVLPGAWLVARRRGVAVKVVSSWIIAIALLAAVLPIVPTPGYKGDHLE